MSKLLIVEESIIVKAIFQDLLEKLDEFDYDMVSSYAEAKDFLSKRRYEYAIVNHILKDAPHGEVIALFNKHYLAPLVFTSNIDEDFFDDFEGAYIVDYIKKIGYNNESNVIKKLQQLQKNKSKTILIVSDSKMYSTYLKQNLNLHSFKVFNSHNNDEFMEKLALHPEMELVIVDTDGPYLNSMEVIEHIRKKKEYENISILVLTKESNSYYTSALLNAGANDFLVKEFSRDEFYVRVYQNINKVC